MGKSSISTYLAAAPEGLPEVDGLVTLPDTVLSGDPSRFTFWIRIRRNEDEPFPPECISTVETGTSQ
jgi:hypothetical protein